MTVFTLLCDRWAHSARSQRNRKTQMWCCINHCCHSHCHLGWTMCRKDMTYRKTSSISRTKSQHLNVSLSSCSCLRSIHWSQVLNWEWRCSWSSADRRCSNYIWVIKKFYSLLRCDLYWRFYGKSAWPNLTILQDWVYFSGYDDSLHCFSL